ncbi:hypothetical protein [Lactobacillus melliventris]|uniref:Uncharacterized protein n=1 Tax=Lactobacillus melliventris TaxID=1218507 RepID=A0ABX5N312_9LACO|nr:hypothetical protein [Lactobacillus melliventris]PXY86159.1 hypothetical protein DK873_01005 [Lactobacillus melliventris]
MKLKKLFNKIIVFSCSLFFMLSLFTYKVQAADIPSDISIWVTPKVVHIKNDEILKNFIFLNQYPNAQQVTYESKQVYLLTYKQNILVSDTSMSVEILGHIYPDEFSKYLPSSIANEIKKHTDVIDSGEKSVDSNRWVWDSIAAVIDYFKLSNNINNTRQNRKKDVSTREIILRIHQMNSKSYLDDEIMKKVINDYKSNKSNFASIYY